jgi:predicted nucleic acid-binding protein
MTLYFDTSALVKLFSREDGSGKVKDLILDSENERRKI